MYCLRVFIVVLQDLNCLYTTIFILIKCVCIPGFTLIGFCVSELHAHLQCMSLVMYGLRLFSVVLQ